MKRGISCLTLAAVLTLQGCSGNQSDADGDGTVSSKERMAELAKNGYLPMEAGRWKTEFKFSEIDVPRLGNEEKQSILREMEQSSSGVSCLSAADASKPGADFFGGEGAEDCTYKKFDIAGNRVTMQVACGMAGMGKVDMDLDGTVGDTKFEYDTKFTVSVPIAGKIKLAGKMTGTHDGACQGNE
jgi:Protein of unknown function (DUF3617)